MSRHELLEQILIARYELDYSPRTSKAACEKALWELVDQAISGKSVSRHELLASLHDRYVEFKRERRRRDKLTGAQRLQG